MVEDNNIDPLISARSQHKANSVFLYAGLLFLFVSLGLFLVSGYSLLRISEMGPIIEIPTSSDAVSSSDVTTKDLYNFIGRILSFFLAPIIMVVSAIVCTFVGISLLKAAGAVTQEVIPQKEYELLAPAIRDGNEKAITEYIRLSSLSGATGTFTKVGLTGLPLATIFLTVVLAFIGVFNEKFFDLAQLTLGAFIGSYVQKRRDDPASITSESIGRP